MRLFPKFSFRKCVYLLIKIGECGIYRFYKLITIFNMMTKSFKIISSPGVVKIALKTLPVRHGEIRQTGTLPDDLNIVSEVENGGFP